VLIISTVALAIFTDIFLYGVRPRSLNDDFVVLISRKLSLFYRSRWRRGSAWNIIPCRAVYRFSSPCMRRA